MPPQRTNLILTPNIPHIKLDILIRHRLDVKPHGRNRSHVLSQLELVQNSRLARGVETEHEEAHFLGSEDLAHYFGDLAAHFVAVVIVFLLVCGVG